MRLKIKVKLRIKGGVKCVSRGDLWTETTVTETEKFHENFIRSVTFPLYKSMLPFLLLFNAVDRAGSLFFFIERCNESPVSSTKRITDKFNRAESPNSLNLNLWHCLDASGGKKKLLYKPEKMKIIDLKHTDLLWLKLHTRFWENS